jgi:catechol 2,3-dioxygenase-like lactoylglutathione lyase family enzyme
MDIESLHHVALTVTDLERSRTFYREILGLEEMARPPFPFAGAWFRVNNGQQLHLIVHTNPTLRTGKGLDSRDVHFAMRIRNYRSALEFLLSRGYREDLDDAHPMKMKVNVNATAGFPQIFILDPDRHVIEINAAKAD